MLQRMFHLAPVVQLVTAKKLAIVFLNVMCNRLGILTNLISDRDLWFVSKFWKSLFSELGTSLNLSTVYHPRANSPTERFNQIVEQTFWGYINLYVDDWARDVSMTEFALSSFAKRTTGSCPVEILHWFIPLGPLSLLNPSVQTEHIHQRINDVWELANTKLELVASQNITVPDYKVGDSIKRDNSNLSLWNQSSARFIHRCMGSPTVLRQVSQTSFILQLWDSF